MKLAPTAKEAEFRDELRRWLAEVVPAIPPPPPGDDWQTRRQYDTAWQRKLYDAGYAGISWPAEHGGRGATASEELIFLEELEHAGAPYVGCNFVGALHAGPTIIAAGTADQQARHLPGILRGDHVRCQGFSEPGSGSDLASLRTRAVRDGDHFVVTGQKIWTSFAHIADFCELLVRTDPDAPKHKGISWLIMPMDLPGIEVRPLRTLLGVSDFNEMFLDEVRIPASNLVGRENDGWSTAMITFSFERGTAFVGELLQSRLLVGELARLAMTDRGSGTPWEREDVRRQLAELTADFDGLWALTRRNVCRADRGLDASVGGSIFKLAYHDARARLGDLAMELLGRAGLAIGEPDLAFAEATPHDMLTSGKRTDHVAERLYALSLGIAAGTEQIQRNIIGERGLGLPKEPR
ncbi:MAG TPA: acyl-CoA dehydrogenase family protein [Acidimicrobiales bacterium]|nr:acyl-CoA dehydrogenase family protein [Acidimicrobiales bacterium]